MKHSKNKVKTANSEYYNTQSHANLKKPHKSKSRKRLDDEKENRRVSLSPHQGRSGTRSRSDKKNNKKRP